jgi:hypothetical protein
VHFTPQAKKKRACHLQNGIKEAFIKWYQSKS